LWNYDIFFIHGAWAGGWFFRRWSAAFASEGWSARAITLPGHGPGEDPRGLGLLDYVEAVEEAVWRPERTVLVGHSMGGWVVMKVMERLPVAATVMLSPVPAYGLTFGVNTSLTMLSPSTAFRSIVLGKALGLPEKVVRKICFASDTEEITIKRFIDNSVPESPTALRQILRLGWKLPGKVKIKPKKLAKSGGRHLIIGSDADFFVKPVELEESAKMLGASMVRLKSYPHCYPYTEQGPGVRALVQEWLEKNLG